MNVLVFEPKYVGHFLGFGKAAANAFADLGCTVRFVVPKEAEGSTQANVKLAELNPRVEVCYSIDVPKMYEQWKNATLESAALGKCLDERPCDWLCVPSGDFLMCGLLLNREVRAKVGALPGGDLIVHNSPQVYPRIGIRNRLSRIADQIAAARLPGLQLHTVDPFAVSDRAKGRIALWGKGAKGLPHFFDRRSDCPTQQEARERLGLPADVKILGSVGDLGRRKGTELAIESFAAAGPPEGMVLALFGKLSGSVKECLRQHEQLLQDGHIVVQDRFINDEEFSDFFPAMDAIWTGYRFHIGIASTQLFAADAGTPVISTNYGSVGWLVEQYGLGATCPPEVSSMKVAIEQFANSKEWRVDPLGVQRLLNHHSTENFARHLTHGIRRELAKRGSPISENSPQLVS